VLDAVGGPVPEGLHGRSLRPILADPEAPWREHLVAEFNFHTRQSFYPRRAIRGQLYKLIHNLLAGRARPFTSIDGDPAYAISQSPAFDGSEVQQAFQTFADPPEFELYDLEVDPVEFHNLAERPERQATLQELKAALWDYRLQTGDPLLDPERVEAMIAYSQEQAPDLRPWWRRLLGSS
jgi:N-sulfoglucosamine sulfohydrolase